MNRATLLMLAAGLALAACETEISRNQVVEDERNDQRNVSSVVGLSDADRRAVEIYAAVIRELVTKDHIFGGGPPAFSSVYVLDKPLPGGNWLRNKPGRSDKFSLPVREALKARLAALPPIDFISDLDSVRFGKDLMGGVKKDGVIVTVGPIQGPGRNVKVANSLWCGGLCGQWLTYRVKHENDTWRVTGTVGPISIS